MKIAESRLEEMVIVYCQAGNLLIADSSDAADIGTLMIILEAPAVGGAALSSGNIGA
jgi:hypothetical protein